MKLGSARRAGGDRRKRFELLAPRHCNCKHENHVVKSEMAAICFVLLPFMLARVAGMVDEAAEVDTSRHL